METNTERNLAIFVNESYHDILRKITAIDNKSQTDKLQITYTAIFDLKNQFLQDFENLTDLILMNCSIIQLENGIFHNLMHLKSINLSNNCIKLLSNNLFCMNDQLESIFLKNNLLTSINKRTFAMLDHLKILDFSYNHISELSGKFLNSSNLNKLYLNCNQIQNVHFDAFHELANLTHLELQHNRIELLNAIMFENTSKLQYLNLNNNRIVQLRLEFFSYLSELTDLHLRNNLLTQTIDKYTFINNPKLQHIDMSDNDIFKIGRKVFIACSKLRTLNLKVREEFDIESITNLKWLRKFELLYENKEWYILRSSFWTVFKNKLALTELKLVIKSFYITKLCDFSTLKSLKYLHIECKEPSSGHICHINLSNSFDMMPQLENLYLIKLNYFKVTRFTMECNNIKRLDLTGVQNCEYVFHRFTSLKYLNLSFSNFDTITESLFKRLVNLENLILRHTKITYISAMDFKYNYKLRFLDCANCSIEVIEDLAFITLRNLIILDLSHNCLKKKGNISVYGIRKEAITLI